MEYDGPAQSDVRTVGEKFNALFDEHTWHRRRSWFKIAVLVTILAIVGWNHHEIKENAHRNRKIIERIDAQNVVIEGMNGHIDDILGAVIDPPARRGVQKAPLDFKTPSRDKRDHYDSGTTVISYVKDILTQLDVSMPCEALSEPTVGCVSNYTCGTLDTDGSCMGIP